MEKHARQRATAFTGYSNAERATIIRLGQPNNVERSLTQTQIYWLRRAHLEGVACAHELRAWSQIGWTKFAQLVYGVKR